MSFELAGTKSNRLAIGARLKIVAGGMTQTEEIRSGGSYLSNHDFRVHFGLANATKIDSVEICWPSGNVDTLSNLQADQFYSVLEGSGIVDRDKILPQEEIAVSSLRLGRDGVHDGRELHRLFDP